MLSPNYNRILFLLSLVGIGISGYLTYMHANHASIPCGANSGCDIVAAHPSAMGFGIPVLSAIPTAGFGLMGYALLMAVSFWRAAKVDNPQAQQTGCRLQLAILTGSVGITIYLTYLEAYVIKAWCKWCLGSAAVVGVMFLVVLIEWLLWKKVSSSVDGLAQPAQPEIV